MKKSLSLVALFLLSGAIASADVPQYRVAKVASYTSTTVIRDVSPAGHIVGWTVPDTWPQAFVATKASGLEILPVPPGYNSVVARGVNSAGVVVGAVATNGYPFDLGEPAIWTPDGAGGYTVAIPPQFAALPWGTGTKPIQGGMAVSINENGVIVGWSRFQGWGGGPATRFFADAPPIDLSALGFTSTVEDLSDTTNIVIGGNQMIDLDTNVVTPLGLPPPLSTGVGFTMVYAYSVNDAGESVMAAVQATSQVRYRTYRRSAQGVYTEHNPSVPGISIVGVYDNNNRGDVSASSNPFYQLGGVYFAAEDVLVPQIETLLVPEDAHWDIINYGFIDDDRRLYTTAIDTTTGDYALVVLEPVGLASATIRNGSGINGLAFHSLSAPVLGSTWNAAIDLAGFGGDVSLLVVSVSAPITVALPFGELLVDAPYVVIQTGAGSHALPLPASQALVGLPVATQGASLDAHGTLRLFNAIDLVLGH